MKISTFPWRNIKTDGQMKFYTGINTIVLLNKKFRFIQPFLSGAIYWKGKSMQKKLAKSGIADVISLEN